MILAKEILSSTRRKNKHSGFTMIELIVALTFALIFVTAVLHTISTFGYSALYSKKNDMEFRKLAEYKLRQINILPSLEDNRKFHVTEYNNKSKLIGDNIKFGLFIEKIPTCLFKSSPVDFIYFSKNLEKGNIVSLYLSGENQDDKHKVEAIIHHSGKKEKRTLGDIKQDCAFQAQISDKLNNILVKPIFSEKCEYPLDFQIQGNAFKDIKDDKIIFNGLIATKKSGMTLKDDVIAKINNWNELSDKKIQFNYQNLLIFQMLGDKIKKLYVYFE